MEKINLWEKVHSQIRETIPSRQYEAWVKDLTLESMEDSAIGKLLKLGVRGQVYRDWIHTTLMSKLDSVIAEHIQGPFKIEFIVVAPPSADEELPSATHYEPQVSATDPALSQRGVLNPEYTFGTFVVGSGNQFAHAACHSVAEKPGSGANPLFLCGPSGTGKTHLLNAVGNTLRDNMGKFRICYISGERFLNDVVMGIRHNQMDKFRQKYRQNFDFLIVDDIHVIARTNTTQEEFFYTFNSFHDAGKQVVVASDRLPREMDGLEDRIRTRLEWGLTVDIQPPDVDTRMAILRYKAERTGLYLPDDVVGMIAQISKKSVRELEGNLATIRMYSELRGVPITSELAKDVFAATLQQQKTGLNIDDIIRMVGEHFKITTKDLKSETRVKTIARPRQIAMYLSRKYLNYGYVEIGRAFGRDHTTVLHAEDKIKELLDSNPDFKSDVSRLENSINNSQWI